ncbi:hypothetical protein LTR56_000420 [Elasticomyces elasticus]|nr:hypothetical protein LTR56_000420 [Elasticomyces elasticus]KAK3666885.1 hypothetical protein LTR22_002110 [Elasticomyces elasticus]KAK4933414.1 hypothetical protein LTR49_000408 [Elasticomyces elasticus]KAK5755495.1 hypothetical protein LTS12_014363 [Elasticomyces elasticus]
MTIKYGNRVKPAHKFVVSQESRYFQQMLENDTGGHITCKLEEAEEDLDSIDRMFAYIYHANINHLKRKRDDWQTSFRIYHVATKYGLDSLRKRALEDTMMHASDSGAETVVKAVQAMSIHGTDPSVKRAEEQLLGQHFLDLMQLPAYVTWMEGQPARALRHNRQMAKALMTLQNAPVNSRPSVASAVRKAFDSVPE